MILMKIISLEIPVKETISNIKIEWKRGDLERMSKRVYELRPEEPKCKVSEMFVKLSAFYRNPNNGKYQPKEIKITVSGMADAKDPEPVPKFLGELEFNLADYVGLAYQEHAFVL